MTRTQATLTQSHKHARARFQLWDNPTKPQTQWYIKDIGEGKFNIMNAKSKKCVNISGHGLKDGAWQGVATARMPDLAISCLHPPSFYWQARKSFSGTILKVGKRDGGSLSTVRSIVELGIVGHI